MNQPVMPRRADQAIFDQLFAEAVLSGEHGIEVAPADGGRRWGVSALLRPDAEAAVALEALARDAAAVAGDGHWLTGAAHSSHLTVRALEWPRPEEVPADDPSAARYASALRTAMAGGGPLAFDVVGLTLTRLSVMACATPVAEAPDRLSAALTEALGEDAWLERGIEFHRSIWYLNLVHFAAPIRPPRARALVDWVAEGRALGPIRVRVAEVEVAAWRFTGTGMTPQRLVAYPVASAVPG